MGYSEQGTIRVRGWRSWYGTVGTGEGVPLVVVHGGPALGHDYLEGLAALADGGRRVVFYDQLGCGRSDRPSDPGLWSMALFVEELAALREQLGLATVHLLGHSFGGALALDYLLTARPAGVAGLVLSNTFASTAAVLACWRGILARMDPGVRALLQRHQAAGTTDDPGYVAAWQEHFVARHVLRAAPTAGLQRSLGNMNDEVYRAMHGRGWMEVTGELATWDVTARLGEIDVPTLVVVGEHDQTGPDVAAALHAGIPGSRLLLLDSCSHLPFVEQPRRYLTAVSAFLAALDTAAAQRGDAHV